MFSVGDAQRPLDVIGACVELGGSQTAGLVGEAIEGCRCNLERLGKLRRGVDRRPTGGSGSSEVLEGRIFVANHAGVRGCSGPAVFFPDRLDLLLAVRQRVHLRCGRSTCIEAIECAVYPPQDHIQGDAAIVPALYDLPISRRQQQWAAAPNAEVAFDLPEVPGAMGLVVR